MSWFVSQNGYIAETYFSAHSTAGILPVQLASRFPQMKYENRSAYYEKKARKEIKEIKEIMRKNCFDTKVYRG